MKDTLRTRLEFLWAKLAGRDVDIDTLTPKAPTNMVEKLMLETAERIADASESGGGGAEPLICTAGWDPDYPGSGSAILDVSYDDIETAVSAGRQVILHLPDEMGVTGAGFSFYLTGYGITLDGTYYVGFSNDYMDSDPPGSWHSKNIDDKLFTGKYS